MANKTLSQLRAELLSQPRVRGAHEQQAPECAIVRGGNRRAPPFAPLCRPRLEAASGPPAIYCGAADGLTFPRRISSSSTIQPSTGAKRPLSRNATAMSSAAR
jgi:hypothetical protein